MARLLFLGIEVVTCAGLTTCVVAAAAPIMSVYWLIVVMAVGLVWQVTKLGEYWREGEAQVCPASICDAISHN